MSGQTATEAANVDNTRPGRWECAVCGAIGPNPDYDSLEAHARDKHPDKWNEFEAATGIGEPVAVAPIIAAIGLGIGASVAVFMATWSIVLAFGGYTLTACLVWSFLWVVGYA